MFKLKRERDIQVLGLNHDTKARSSLEFKFERMINTINNLEALNRKLNLPKPKSIEGFTVISEKLESGLTAAVVADKDGEIVYAMYGSNDDLRDLVGGGREDEGEELTK